MSTTLPATPPAHRTASEPLRWLAAILVFVGTVVAVAAIGNDDLIAFLSFPLAIPFGVAFVVAPAVQVARNVRSRTTALIAIGLVCAELCVALGAVGWHFLQKHQAHARAERGIQAFVGMHGEHDGVRFEVRATPAGEIFLLVDMHRSDLVDGEAHTKPEYWQVHCYNEDAVLDFRGNEEEPWATATEARLDFSQGETYKGTFAPPHPLPFCTFDAPVIDLSAPRFSTYLPMRR